jgi:hypothetical protein
MISAKRQPIDSAQPAAKEISGKYVILAVVAVALTGSVASWVVRYNATHRAADFWGSAAAVLIRDAPTVQLVMLQPAKAPAVAANPLQTVVLDRQPYSIARQLDISKARGLIHLRTAFLEDRSFDWLAHLEQSPTAWHWGLQFADPGPQSIQQSVGTKRTIWFTSDCKFMMRDGRDENPGHVISSEPIATGLREMFGELSGDPVTNSR